MGNTALNGGIATLSVSESWQQKECVNGVRNHHIMQFTPQRTTFLMLQ
jgi:hypothetical protein